MVRFSSILVLAACLATISNFLAAAQLANGSQATEGSDLNNNYRRAAAAEETGNYDEAIRELRAAKKSGHYDGRLPAALGVALFHEGFVSDAIEEFREALRLRPQDVDVRSNLAAALLQFDDFQDAIPHLARVIRDDPNDRSSPGAFVQLSDSSETLGRSGPGTLSFVAESRLKGDFPAAKFELGELYWQAGMLDEAAAELQSLCQAHPDFLATYFPLAEVLRQKGEIDEAASITRTLLRSSESAAGYQELAIIQKQKGDIDDAAKSFHKAEELRNLAKPREAARLLTLAAVHLMQEKNEKGAIEKLRFAVRLDATSAEAHYQLGVALHLQGEDTRALSEFKVASAFDPQLKLPYGWR